MLLWIAGVFVWAPLGAQRLKSLEQEYAALFERCKGFAVTISVSALDSERPPDGFAPGSHPYRVSIGSGIIYDTLGHILTTATVTDHGVYFKVTFANGRTLPARLLGTDKLNNVSMLQVEGCRLIPARFGDSEKLTPGFWVGLIGNSFGVFPAFAHGTAAGKNRDGDILMSVDLAPGSAGGPVVNSDGNVVAMISSKLSESVGLGSIRVSDPTARFAKPLVLSDAEMDLPIGGMSLAIPASKLLASALNILAGNARVGGFLGVFPEDLDLEWVKLAAGVASGVYVASVLEGSPAQTAGVRDGDILFQFQGRQILNSDQLRKLIFDSRPGESVSLSLLRSGRIIKLRAQVGSFAPIEYSYSTRGARPPVPPPEGMQTGVVGPGGPPRSGPFDSLLMQIPDSSRNHRGQDSGTAGKAH